MQTKVLIIGYVWLETTSAAGSRMLQLINLFKAQNWDVTFASPAQKTVNSLDVSKISVTEVFIDLNATSFDNFIRELNPAVVVFDRFMMEEQFGWRVTENCSNALKILDTEDLHFLRKVRYQQLKKGEEFTEEALLKSEEAKREIASILRCDLSLIISSFEMNLLKNSFKINEKILCYLPFLLDKIELEREVDWPLFSERENFIFMGNFLHKPNVDAVLQLKTIWKTIRKKLPNAVLHVYGAYATQQIQQLHNKKEGFIIKGFVKDIVEVVKNAKVVLAPIRFGAGIKGKLTQAMQWGTPSVTTAIGAEGMHDFLEWNGFVENDFKQFADKAILLFSDEKTWKKSQQNGIEIINKIYDKKKVGKVFLNRFFEIQENLESHRMQNFMGSLVQYKTLQATKYMSKWIEEKNKN